MNPLFKFLHLASVIVWVGGMFFAYVCLRPVAASQLAPTHRSPTPRMVKLEPVKLPLV